MPLAISDRPVGEAPGRATPILRPTVLSRGSLAFALVPVFVAVVRAVATGWVPMFDAAYFTVRSRDVLTSNHPWLGAWSSSSANLDATIRNLGPLQLDLLAPFTKVAPYAGTAIGVGVVSAGSIVLAWRAAHWAAGPRIAAVAMIGTLAVEISIGSQAFIDPRQQLYLLLPFWALLWLTWALAQGCPQAIVPWVFVASLITQTHFTYVPQTAVLALGGSALFAMSLRRHRGAPPWRASAFAGAATAVVCWAQPLWDAVAGEHNLGTVLSQRSASEGVGWVTGIRVMATTSLSPPRFWLPDTMADLRAPPDLVATGRAVAVLATWFLALGLATVVAKRRGRRHVWRLGLVATIGLGAAVVAAAAIPRSAFGVIPQNYFWMWPLALFASVAFAVCVVSAFPALRGIAHTRVGMVAVVAAGTLLAVPATRPLDPLGHVASVVSVGQRLGRPVVEDMATWLPLHGVTGPVVIDYSRASFGNSVGYLVLAELQRAGVEFVFPAGDRNLDRFGRERCDGGRATFRLVVTDAGGPAGSRDGERVLVHVDAFTDADADELAQLDERFGELMRSGEIAVDIGGMEHLGGEQPRFRRVLSTPGAPASGLARAVDRWVNWGVVEIPSRFRSSADRWTDLELRSDLEDVTILLAPVTTTADDKAACSD